MDQMKLWKEKLEEQGYIVEVPTLVDFHTIRDVEGDLERFESVKRRETKNHFEKVKQADIILVLNYDKDGKHHYVSGNTFAEIAYAMALNFCHGKRIEIYTVNPLPQESPYFEELSAWQVRQWTS